MARLESTAEAAAVLGELDGLLQRGLAAPVEDAVARARAMLASTGEPFGWAAVDTGAAPLPPGIRSAWVFVIRGRSHPEPHRHPNSIQHLRSLHGAGRVILTTPDGRSRGSGASTPTTPGW